jgi:hypothetical protein
MTEWLWLTSPPSSGLRGLTAYAFKPRTQQLVTVLDVEQLCWYRRQPPRRVLGSGAIF